MSQSEEVQTKVLNALYWDLVVPTHRVKVEVENGWVTISGTVDRYYQRTCANPTRAGLLACSASTIIFGMRRRTRSKGPPPTSDRRSPARPGFASPNGRLSAIAVVVNPISNALRGQSARRRSAHREIQAN